MLFPGLSLVAFARRIVVRTVPHSLAYLVWPLVLVISGSLSSCGQRSSGGDGSSEKVGKSVATVCNNATLTGPSGPVPIGTPVTLTATASCGPEDTPNYLFQYQLQGTSDPATSIGDWSTQSTVTWNTTGLVSGRYNVTVQVRRSATGPIDTVGLTAVLTGNVCTNGALSAAPAGPQPAGTPIALTGSAICPNGSEGQYRFYYRPETAPDYRPIRDIWGGSTATWDTTDLPSGRYDVVAYIRAQGSTASYETFGTIKYLIGNVCNTVTLSTTPAGPQPVGTAVALSAAASCLPGAVPEYQFLYQPPAGGPETVVQPWGSSSSVTWKTPAFAPADYRLIVQVRGAQHQSLLEATQSKSYRLTSPCTGTPDSDADGIPDSCDPCDNRTDSDGDGIRDCIEQNDSYTWTDAHVFNGPLAERGDTCSTQCTGGLTQSGLDECLATHPPVQSQSLISGWSWTNASAANSCATQFNFSPQWSSCPNPWYTSYKGVFSVEASGNHCFSIVGTNVACSALFFDGNTVPLNGGRRCFQRDPSTLPINWLFQPTAGTQSTFSVKYCFGGSIECEPSQVLPQALLRPGVPVGGGGTGALCQGTTQCQPGLVCGVDNGARFGGARTDDVCWVGTCATSAGSAALGCGFQGALCGSKCDSAVPCSSNSDCASGEVCGAGNGWAFDSNAGNVCWPASCETATGQSACGTVNDPCGKCSCTPNCAGKTCGSSDLSDGCGGVCAGLCADRSVGCTEDWQCHSGSVCMLGAGPQIGQPAGTNVCLPRACNDADVKRIPCGDTNATCGTCPVCVPDCEGRTCGPDPRCGVECGAACSAGNFCNATGQCASVLQPLSLSVPDGTDTTRNLLIERIPQTRMPTRLVGATPGSFAVSDRGTATYDIPIDVPPGRAGMQPHISLRYTSTKSNGLLGVGWSIEGLSTISRCQRTFAEDGDSEPVQLDGTDAFCLDGKRLAQVGDGGASGTSQVEYRTEIDTFAKIVAFYSDTDTPDTGPSYFKVWNKDGSILSYGATQDSTILGGINGGIRRAWALSRVEDHVGNFMQIVYANYPSHCVGPDSLCGTAEVMPLSITYTGFGAQSGDRTVSFVYNQSRSDVLLGFAPGGTVIERTRLLQAIETYAQGKPIRAYHLEYETTSNNVNRIISLEEWGFSGSFPARKPKTRFTYNSTAYVNFGQQLDTGVNLEPAIFWHADVLDANGDGADDILVPDARRVDNGLRQYYGLLLSAPSGASFTNADTNLPSTDNENPNGPLHVLSHLDYNHDGREDLIVADDKGHVYVEASNGAGFDTVASIRAYTDVSDDDAPRGTLAAAADWDGDGLQDIIVRNGDGACEPGRDLHLYRQLRSGGFTSPLVVPPYGRFTNVSPLYSCFNPLLLDTNGDGVQNFLGYGDKSGWASLMLKTGYVFSLGQFNQLTWQVSIPAGSSVPVNNYSSFLNIDINADGLRDLYAFDWPTKRTSLFINNSLGFLRQSFYGNSSSQVAFSDGVVVDFDGDGREDVLRPLSDQNLDRWVVEKSVQYNSLAPPVEIASPPAGVAVGGTHSVKIADINGDGIRDLLVLRNSDRRLIGLLGTRTNLLETITDGLGKVIKVDYSPHPADFSSDGETYTPLHACDWPTHCLNRVEHALVSAHTESESDPAAGAYRTFRKVRYKYTGARAALSGGWLGFDGRSIEEVDGANNPIRTTVVGYDNSSYVETSSIKHTYLFPQAGLPVSVVVHSAPASSQIASFGTTREVVTANTWLVKNGATGGPFAYLATSQVDVGDGLDALGGGAVMPLSRTTHAYEVDNYGNVTAESHRTESISGNGAFPPTVISNTEIATPYEAADTAAWLVARLHRRQVRDSQAGTQTRTTEYGYDPNGLVETVTKEPDDGAYKIITTYGRSTKGNITSIDSVDASGKTLLTTISYDERDLFPRIITQKDMVTQKAQTTEVVFDDAFGKLAVRLDPNRIPEQWAYDAFGRVSSKTGPEGSTSIDYDTDSVHADGPVSIWGALAVHVTTDHGPDSTREFDSLGRLVATTIRGYNGVPTHQEFQYDAGGLLRLASRPHLLGDYTQGIVQYSYDAQRRLSLESYPNGESLLHLYATRNTVISALAPLVSSPNALEVSGVINARSSSHLIVSDDRGNPVVTSDNLSATGTRYTYDAFNVLASITDAHGPVTTIVPDKYGRVQSMVDADMGETVNGYNAFDQLTFTRDADQRYRFLFYDGFGRLDHIEDSDGVTQWTYDGTGPNETNRLVEVHRTNPDNSAGPKIRYQYEPPTATYNRGLLQSAIRTIDGNDYATNFEYDPYSRLQVVHYPANAGQYVVQNVYDDYGHVTAVQDALHPTNNPIWQVTSADQGYRVGTERLANGVTTERSYEPFSGALSRIRTTHRELDGSDITLQNFSYEYDTSGNVTFRHDDFNQTHEKFVYDLLDRLKTTSRAAGTGTYTPELSFDYDDIGNLTQKSDVGVYTPSPDHRHAPATAGSNSYFYYGNGNLRSRSGPLVPNGVQTFHYTAFDLPNRITTEGEATPTTFDYDPNEVRVMKDGPDKKSIYSGELYERRTDKLNGAVEHRYRIFAGTGQVAEVVRTGSGSSPSDTVYYLHGDHVGSIQLLTNAQGSAQRAQAFKPYGATTSLPVGGTTEVHAGFTGQEHDADVDLINMKGRLYDPELGRFTTPDPFVQAPYFSQSLNRYSYAFNNPLRFIDPSGFDGEPSPTNPPPPPEYPIVITVTGERPSGDPSPELMNDWTAWAMTQIDSHTEGPLPPSAPSASSVVPQTPANVTRIPGGYDSVALGDWAPSAENDELTPYIGPQIVPSAPASPPAAASGDAATIQSLLFGTSTVANAVGSAESAVQFSNVRNGMWIGANGEWYPLSWGGNQYAGSRSAALKGARLATRVGKGAFAVGAVISALQGLESLSNKNYLGAAKSGLDIGVGYIGVVGGPGVAVGATVYWVVDLTIGWQLPIGAADPRGFVGAEGSSGAAAQGGASGR